MDPDDALTALHSTSSLRDVARASFTGFSAVKLHTPVPGVVYTPRSNNFDLLNKWSQSAGKSLTELILCDFRTADSVDIALMLSSLERDCHALRNLNIVNMAADNPTLIQDILNKTYGRLRDLVLDGSSIDAVERSGAGLRKLTIRGECPSIVAALCTVGRTWEDIEVSDKRLTRSDFVQVRGLCPHLSRINLKATDGNALVSFADILCPYRAQLRFAGDLNEMHPAQTCAATPLDRSRACLRRLRWRAPACWS